MSRPDSVTSLIVQQFLSGCSIFLTDIEHCIPGASKRYAPGPFSLRVILNKDAEQQSALCSDCCSRQTLNRNRPTAFDRPEDLISARLQRMAEKNLHQVLNYSATNSSHETRQESGSRYRRWCHKKHCRFHLVRIDRMLGCFSIAAGAVANRC